MISTFFWYQKNDIKKCLISKRIDNYECCHSYDYECAHLYDCECGPDFSNVPIFPDIRTTLWKNNLRFHLVLYGFI